jgi:hypothetical protein
MQRPITGSPKIFADIDGAVLQTPRGNIPYRRLLSFHARCSYKYAKDKGWINSTDTFQEYFDLSEGASNPDAYKYL